MVTGAGVSLSCLASVYPETPGRQQAAGVRGRETLRSRRISPMVRPEIPPEMRGYYFDFNWSNERVWAQDAPVEVVPLSDLAWHLDIPIWSTVQGQPRFDLRPRDVLGDPAGHPRHAERLAAVDTSYPLDAMWTTDRLVILDGIHRLARLLSEGADVARVRRHPRTSIARIRRV